MQTNRIKPTEKYKEYENKIRMLGLFIDAQLNGKLSYLVPLQDKDRLRGQERSITQCYIMADWIGEVQVYHIVTPADPTAKKYHHCLGPLPQAIEDMVGCCKYLGEADRQPYFERIKQLDDLRKARFDETGARRTGE